MRDKHRKEKDMPDEVGTEAIRSDAPSVDDDLFGDAAADDKAAVSVDEQNADGEAPQETQQDSNAAEEPADAEAEASLDGRPEGRRVHQGRQGHHRGAAALGGPAHRDLRRPGRDRADE